MPGMRASASLFRAKEKQLLNILFYLILKTAGGYHLRLFLYYSYFPGRLFSQNKKTDKYIQYYPRP